MDSTYLVVVHPAQLAGAIQTLTDPSALDAPTPKTKTLGVNIRGAKGVLLHVSWKAHLEWESL